VLLHRGDEAVPVNEYDPRGLSVRPQFVSEGWFGCEPTSGDMTNLTVL
jgi:hypothetical protein